MLSRDLSSRFTLVVEQRTLLAIQPFPAAILMKYRSEIDGLRALAILPVIFYHAGLESFRGGFVGVDVFFVISGYLISSIVLGERDKGTFSLMRFYERRARRILPALFCMMLICIPFAWSWLVPLDLKDFSQSLVAVSTFASNIYFFKKSGYFDTNTELKPLIHTWSLSLEEQYYMLFPLFVLLVWRFGQRKLVILVASLAIASFLLAQRAVADHPEAAFYLLPTRAWELLMGVMAALFFRSSSRLSKARPAPVAEATSLVGIALIGYAVFNFDSHTPFPSFYTLAPTIGALLIIIFATADTMVARLLSSRLLVGIGLISYSAYLWHQPIFAFVRHRFVDRLDVGLATALSFLALVVGWLSWRFVERPFRSVDRVGRRSLLTVCAVFSCIFVGYGFAGHIRNGFPDRTPPSYLAPDYFTYIKAEKKDQHGIDGKLCVADAASICEAAKFQDSQGEVLLVGDSHSADYVDEFKDYLNAQNFNGSQMAMGGCAFLDSQTAQPDGRCQGQLTLLRDQIASRKFDQIIVVGNYYDHTAQQAQELRDKDLRSFASLLNDMLRSGAKVTFFSPRFSLTREPLRAAMQNNLDLVHVNPMTKSVEDWNSLLNTFSEQRGFMVFNQGEYLIEAGCGQKQCFDGHTSDGKPLYRDLSHLTQFGAKIVFSKFAALESKQTKMGKSKL